MRRCPVLAVKAVALSRDAHHIHPTSKLEGTPDLGAMKPRRIWGTQVLKWMAYSGGILYIWRTPFRRRDAVGLAGYLAKFVHGGVAMMDQWIRNGAMKAMFCGCIAIPLLVGGCKSGPPPAADMRDLDEQTIRDLDRQWSMAAQTNNLDEVMSYYSEDASLLPPNAPMATGKAAIREVWASLLKPGTTVTWQTTKVEAASSRDLAYVMGTYLLHAEDSGGKPIADHGKILEVWKRTPNDEWKTVADTWNSDVSETVDAGKK